MNPNAAVFVPGSAPAFTPAAATSEGGGGQVQVMQVRPQPVQMPQSDAGKDGRADVEEGSKGFSDDGKGSRKGKGNWRKGKDNGKGQPFVRDMPGKGLPVKGGKDGGKDLGNRGGKDFG